MALPHKQTEASSAESAHTPLRVDSHQHEEVLDDTQLDHSLLRLETFLRIFGFCQFSFISFTLSWVSFLLLGVALPLALIERSYCSDCEKYEIKSFEIEILVSESLVAASSLLCISHNLRKYGVKKFLFVDRYHGNMAQFREEYLQKINGFFRLLAVWLLPCFLLKTAREVIHMVYVHNDSWWQSIATLFALLVSWTYSAIIYLSGTVLFNLVCNLQIIHFENYGKLLESDLDVSLYIEEHIRLKHHLSKISHRFRIFLLLEFLFVTASQFLALLETTGNKGIINFSNGGDFAVCSIVELVGIIIFLQSAAKISHRAQSLASVTSRWHALLTCNSDNASQTGISNNVRSMEAAIPAGPLHINYSESDMESIDYVPVPTNSQLASNMSLYHKRQALVMYMQSNLGGVTIFGWTIDRALLNTVFFIELSLVLFVLGKTITFTTK
ncbi:uncharacterized protein LOC122280566 isoform X2 [Carya illinoinensis]|uniref:Uncharacterized protein n=1 Tax=Carya illinoinensis TaxID=32201 RepID=A0A8T1P007_CARIL|nr:uncharacterized protein LOC122280566 isoform X2 [Carya illinoinensis]KAG6634984.1 hypothetical protein CIPAW_11G010400 [Carya illinoinensis]